MSGTMALRPPLTMSSPNSMEETMCYERRSYGSDERRKAGATTPSKERESKRDEVVSNLMRDAEKAGEKTEAGAPSKEYIPAK